MTKPRQKSTAKKRKPPPKADASTQYKRFLEAAKEAGASDDPKALAKAVKKVAPAKRKKD